MSARDLLLTVRNETVPDVAFPKVMLCDPLSVLHMVSFLFEATESCHFMVPLSNSYESYSFCLIERSPEWFKSVPLSIRSPLIVRTPDDSYALSDS